MSTSTETTKNEEMLQKSISRQATIDAVATSPGSDFHDAEGLAVGFVGAAITTRTLDLLLEAPRTLVDSTVNMFEVAPGTVSARLAYLLYLDALATSPEVLKETARRLRQQLIDTDPRLQVLYGEHVG